MSKFSYDGPLLTREEFLSGDVGVHLVEGAPITGTKYVDCNYLWHPKRGLLSTERCEVSVKVPTGEHVINYEPLGIYHSNGWRHSRASGIQISAPCADIITSAHHGPYAYSKTNINRPWLCSSNEFFDLGVMAGCGMHFTYDTRQDSSA